jgi:hypothetical protein
LRARAQREASDVHPFELQRLATRDDVITTGISAADMIGVHGGARDLELYAPERARDSMIAEHGVEDSRGTGASGLRVRLSGCRRLCTPL